MTDLQNLRKLVSILERRRHLLYVNERMRLDTLARLARDMCYSSIAWGSKEMRELGAMLDATSLAESRATRAKHAPRYVDGKP